eukprot:CAMPEP_0175577124 /NCGR_PEP_ID=MMETSP0096-20121207/45424_1 /TAXON_ID=311494 /ORGANISM="Alexandrium monilatum, Strain CCMP3105" /LENGTH=140 /DNA_ID=CAMNT_0016880685 /DNA_START=89 /DNA_END=513 /DNA_ORIENTATION=+
MTDQPRRSRRWCTCATFMALISTSAAISERYLMARCSQPRGAAAKATPAPVPTNQGLTLGNCGRHVQTLERKRHVDGDAWLELSWAGSLVEVLHHGVHDGSGDDGPARRAGMQENNRRPPIPAASEGQTPAPAGAAQGMA